MTDYDRLVENGKKIGAYSMGSAVQAAAAWVAENWEEFDRLRGSDGASGIIKEIMTLGFRELQAVRAQIADEEERERSEKDCLWEHA